MANIAGDWNKSMPSGSSSVSDGDDLLRQHWASIESTFVQAHRFGSAETLAGYHKPGTARVYTGLSSSNSTTHLPESVEEDRVFAELDTGRLFLTGLSAITCMSPGIGAWNVRDGTITLAVGANAAIFDTEYVDVTPVSGQAWFTPSGATLTVPSGASGYYYVTASISRPFGLPSDISVTDELEIAVQKNGVSQAGFVYGEFKSRTTEEAITIHGIFKAKSQDSLSVRIDNGWDEVVASCSVNFMGHKVG